MNFNQNEYVIHGVGNYQLCFDTNLVVPLNHIVEDKIIHTSTKNFLVLRHAVVDSDSINEIFKTFDNKIKQIHMNHLGIELGGDATKLIESQITNATLRYFAIDSKHKSIADYKIIIEFDDIEFAKKVKDKL